MSGGAAPLYHQLFLFLRERIRSGAFPAGAVLPGEQELARKFEVSRITVKRALNELATAGLVSRHRGRGTVVTFNPSIPVVKGSFENLLESLKIMGLSTEVELIRVAEIDAEDDAADLLELAAGQRVQRAVRLRKIEGEPFSYLTTYVPASIARLFRAEQLRDTPLLSLLEAAGHVAVEAEQWVTAAAAEAPVAGALRTAVGSPLLKITRVMREADGRPIEALIGFYRPERFQHHMKLTRTTKNGKAEWG